MSLITGAGQDVQGSPWAGLNIRIRLKELDVVSATGKIVSKEWVTYRLDKDGNIYDPATQENHIDLPDTADYEDGQPYVIRIGNLPEFEFELDGDTTLADLYDDFADREVGSAVNIRDKVEELTQEVIEEGVEIDANRGVWNNLAENVDFDGDTVSGVYAEKIEDGTVSGDAFKRIGGLTGDAQTQITANATAAAANATHLGALPPVWTAGTYSKGAQVTFGDKLYSCILARTSGDTSDPSADTTGWKPVDKDTDTTYTAGAGMSLTGTEFAVTNPFTAGDETKLVAQANAWSVGTYSENDFVAHQGKYYSCVTARTPSNTSAPPDDSDGWSLLGTGSGDAEEYTAGSGLSLSAGNEFSVDNPFTDADETKLDGIAEGAQVNIQSDWNEAQSTAGAYIKNKPTIPAAPLPAGALPQEIAGTGTVASLDAGDTADITVTGVTGDAYVEQGTSGDADKIVVLRQGTYQLTGDITSEHAANDDRTAPSFSVDGTGVEVIFRSNPYLRDSDSDITVQRMIQFTVASNNTTVTLQLFNEDILEGNFDVRPIDVSGIANLRILPVGGQAGVEGPAGEGGGTTYDADNRLNMLFAGTGVITNAEFNTLNNARSEIQHQLDHNKAEADGNKDALEELFREIQLVGSYAWTTHGPPRNANEISFPLANTVYVRSDGTNYTTLAGVIVANVLLTFKTTGKDDKKFRVVNVTAFASTHVLQLTGHYEVDGDTFASGDSVEIHVEDIDGAKIGEIAFTNPPVLNSTQQANVRRTIGAAGGSSGISGVEVKDEGTALSTEATGLNFTGRLVTASGTGAEKKVHVEGLDARTFTFDRFFIWATPEQARRLHSVYLSWDGSGFWEALYVEEPDDPSLAQPIEIILEQGLEVPTTDFAIHDLSGKIMDVLQSNKQTGTSGNVNSAGKWIVDQKDSLNNTLAKHEFQIHSRAPVSTTYTKAEAAARTAEVDAVHKAMQAEWHLLDELSARQIGEGTWQRSATGGGNNRGRIVLEHGNAGSFTFNNASEWAAFKDLFVTGAVIKLSRGDAEAIHRITGITTTVDAFFVVSYRYVWISGNDSTVGAVGQTGITAEVQEVNEEGIARISFNADIFDTLYLNVSEADVLNLVDNILSFDNVNTWVPEGYHVQLDNDGFLVTLAVPNNITIPASGALTITPGVGTPVTFDRSDLKTTINAIAGVGDWSQGVASRRDINEWTWVHLGRKAETLDMPKVWVGSAAYTDGTQVLYEQELYIAKQNIADTVTTNPSADTTNWAPAGRALTAVEQGKLDDGPGKWQAAVHNVGDFAVWDGKVYICKLARVVGDTDDPATDSAGWEVVGSGSGSTFTPSKPNIYSAVKAVMHPDTNAGVTADDTNNQLNVPGDDVDASYTAKGLRDIGLTTLGTLERHNTITGAENRVNITSSALAMRFADATYAAAAEAIDTGTVIRLTSGSKLAIVTVTSVLAELVANDLVSTAITFITGSRTTFAIGDMVKVEVYGVNATKLAELVPGSGGGSGEDNVQSDYDVTDDTSDAFIKNKPTDADIGEKAFKNPPTLNDAEQLAVRTRISAGGSDDHTEMYIVEYHANFPPIANFGRSLVARPQRITPRNVTTPVADRAVGNLNNTNHTIRLKGGNVYAINFKGQFWAHANVTGVEFRGTRHGHSDDNFYRISSEIVFPSDMPFSTDDQARELGNTQIYAPDIDVDFYIVINAIGGDAGENLGWDNVWLEIATWGGATTSRGDARTDAEVGQAAYDTIDQVTSNETQNENFRKKIGVNQVTDGIQQELEPLDELIWTAGHLNVPVVTSNIASAGSPAIEMRSETIVWVNPHNTELPAAFFEDEKLYRFYDEDTGKEAMFEVTNINNTSSPPLLQLTGKYIKGDHTIFAANDRADIHVVQEGTLAPRLGALAFRGVPNDLSNTEKSTVRNRIGAGTSSFDGANQVGINSVIADTLADLALVEVGVKSTTVNPGSKPNNAIFISGAVVAMRFSTDDYPVAKKLITLGGHLKLTRQSNNATAILRIDRINITDATRQISSSDSTYLMGNPGAFAGNDHDVTVEAYQLNAHPIARFEQMTFDDQTTRQSTDTVLTPGTASVIRGSGSNAKVLPKQSADPTNSFRISAGLYQMHVEGTVSASKANAALAFVLLNASDDSELVSFGIVTTRSGQVKHDQSMLHYFESDAVVKLRYDNIDGNYSWTNMKLEILEV